MSEDEFEFVSSQPEKKAYETVPEETVYKFIGKSPDDFKKFGYKLKVGSKLPYATKLGGSTIE